jgi:hypothetical protein
MTGAIGVEVDCPFTPAVLRKVVYAGSQSSSFPQAPKDLAALAEVQVSREQVRRWTTRVGQQRVEEANRQAQAYEQLPIPEKQQSPSAQVPQVACVQMDGGRIQIRDRQAEPPSAGSKGHWRETLVGCCLSMVSQERAADPCPMVPQTFVDPVRMNDLSREIKGFSGDAEAAEGPPEEAPADREGCPQVLVKSVVATRAGVLALGKQLVAEAHRRGFHAARRKAFVADGSATNWGVHRKHFSHYTPVLDFTHAVCYVYAAAMAGRSGPEAWRDYRQWAQWLWSGSIRALITAVAARSQELGPAREGDETSPAAVVAKTLGYLQNQRSRMNYSHYRKLGLPITSSHIESTIKQINRRVKGTEKFWHQGAEPLLRLAADHISETNAFDRFWKTRRQRLQPIRRYQTTQGAA